MGIRVIIGFLLFVSITFAAPGDSTLNESFSSSIYPQWPDGWYRFSFETATTNFWEQSNQQHRSSPYCIKCDGSNHVRNHDWVITRMVYPTQDDTLFSFWYEAQNHSVYESLEVWVSTTTPDTNGMTVKLDAFRFNNNVYQQRVVSLKNFINTPIYVGIYYPPFNRLGARIDDVIGPHYPDLDVSPIAITSPGSSFLSPGSFTPTATIKNYGSTSPASFSVVCTLYNKFNIQIYSDEQNIAPFLPNTTTSVNFNATPALTLGDYTLVVRTLLSGDCQFINDRKVRTIAIIQGTEKLYDDGVVTQAVYRNLSGEGYGVKFTPTSYPKIIQGAEVMLSHEAYPPQPSNNIFRIRLIDDDGLQGAPGTILWESNDLNGNRGDWNYIPTNEISLTSGSYYLFWIQGENYTQCSGIGADEVPDAPNGTQWRCAGGTYSQNGLPNGDLMIRSCESELISDAGVTEIIAPLASVDSGQIVTPQAMVKNFGNISLMNIPVRFNINGWQNDTIISSLSPNESTLVSFVPWLAAPRGNLVLQCSTNLTGDINFDNDCQTDSLFVRVLDVHAISISNSTGAETLDQGDTLNPQAIITNQGNTDVTFNAQFKISDGYSDDTILTLDAGNQININFANWSADTSGNFWTECTTQLDGDMNQSNDKVTDSLFVQYLDVQTIAIIKPTGNFYLGDTATPQATVCNNSNVTQTFPVRFAISDGYSDVKTVNNLLPGDTTLVSFDQWTASTAGTFETKCSTQLTDDLNPANDKQTGSVFVGFIDVGITVILSPPAFVDSGSAFVPQARIKNFGNVTLSNIPARFRIGYWQVDTLVPTLAPNESIIVSFPTWIASPIGPLGTKCSTRLANDMNKANDRQDGIVFVRLPDIQAISIIQPTGMINLGDTMTPRAIIQNNGNIIITTPARFEISDGYFNMTTATVKQDSQKIINFALWTANTPGNFTTKCSTRLYGDVYQFNDKITGSVFVQYLDVQTLTIISPAGDFFLGDTITPQATIRNNGNTSQTFPIRFSISDGYSDIKTVNNLEPGSTTTMYFSLWTASTSGTFETKCSTQLTGDMNKVNDKQTGSVFVGSSDVGVTSILNPPSIVDSGQTIIPQAIIKNFSSNTVNNIPVRFTIGFWQDDTILGSLGAGESTIASFAAWTANQRGSCAVKCSTRLAGDLNPSNDRQTSSVFVRVLDVQTVSIQQPSGLVHLGDTVTPQAGIRNNGNTSVTLSVRLEITNGYSDEIPVTINPDTQTTVNFDLWTADIIGNLTVKCSTKLANDMNPLNDKQTASVLVEIIDVGTSAILSPPAMVDSGQTVSPQAVIKNFGTTTATNIPVRFTIGGWQDDTMVTSLAPDESTTVTFANWTANQRGNFAFKCSTCLNDDNNPSNNQQTGSLLVRVLDVQTISILQPTGTVNQGDTLTPRAAVQNNGNTAVTFSVRFEIADGYSSEISLILNPLAETTVNFALWTANTAGNFATKCSTKLTGDLIPANDKQVGSVLVGFVDVGMTVILSPPAMVDSGIPLNPQAMVKNFGNIVVSFPVRFTIGGWSSDTTVTNLLPNDSRAISFTAWTPSQRGMFEVKCSTRLSSDQNHSNDKLDDSVLIRVEDVQPITIIQPTGTRNQGDTITPRVSVRNNGNTPVTFPVLFTISDGYADTQTVNSLAPGTSTTISFSLWTAYTIGNFQTKCSTGLVGDRNVTNDKISGSIIVQNIDVQCTSIDEPFGTVNQGSVIAPKATIRNNGNTEQTFNVLFTISGGYSNTQNITLSPGASQQVIFTDWTAGPLGMQTVKCTTELTGDMNNNNDKQTGSVMVQALDAQTVSILAPTGTVNQGITLNPQAVIRNNGNTVQNIPIRFTISDGYSDDTTVTINAGQELTVDFLQWTADTPGTFQTKCSTRLTSDMNPANDKQIGSVFIQNLDVQCLSIDQPVGTVDLGTIIAPKATIHNNGNTSQTFNVLFTITGGYSNTQNITLGPGATQQVTFADWTAGPIGSQTAKCTTQLVGDMNSGNDLQSGSVLVQNLDAQCLSIDQPVGTIYLGTVIAPKATIHNNGNTSQTFNILFAITGGYSNTQNITLGPGATQQVTFTDWTAGPMGMQTVKCTTELIGDMNNNNDKQIGSVLVQALDAQTVSILAPTGIVNKGTTLNPQAIIRNNGNTTQSIPVRFTISDGYVDDTTVIIDAGQELTIDFAQWTADTAGNFQTRCSTELVGDMNLTNDTISGTVFVQNLDVQCLSIDEPTGTVNQATIITPQATICNNGNTEQTFNVLFTISGGYSNARSITLGPGASQQVFFANWLAGPPGKLGTKCTTLLAGDMNINNDVFQDSVVVQNSNPSGIWEKMTDIPALPSNKNPKTGSCMSVLGGKIYYLKASNTQDFFVYTPDEGPGIWIGEIADTMPLGLKEAGDGKKPKRGASLTAYGTGVYVLRGNNTPGFWKFETDTIGGSTFGWHKLTNIPTAAKNPKDASGLVVINKAGTDYIFAMKGSRTDEFYFYDMTANTWSPTSTKPSMGSSGKIGYKKGSCLTYDGNNYVYVLKGNYGDFFRYDLASATWTELKRYNHKVFINRDGKKKKVGEGSGIIYYDNAIYLLKGGNTREFWKYEISTDTWIQMNPADAWDIPTGERNKKVKGGGSLIIAGDYLYVTKGANTREFYRHKLPTSAIALLPSQPASDGTVGNSIILDIFKLSISPNPTTNLVSIKYSLPASGPITFRLYNVTGELVKSYNNPASTKDGKIKIDTRSLLSGIYILRFNSGDIGVSKKLILQK